MRRPANAAPSALDTALMTRAQAALDQVPTDPAGCPHLAQWPLALLCAEHPGLRFMCPPCSVDHDDRGHDDAFRFRCDGCRAVDPDLIEASVPGGLLVVDGRPVLGLVVQLGGCTLCHARDAGRGVG